MISLRLQGPLSANGTGRVEIFYNGQWGTICDDHWDINDAGVVCRQLGYLSAVRALQGSQVPSGTGQIWLDDVTCTGSETSLASCSHGGWGNHNCGHSEDSGVECSSTGKYRLIHMHGSHHYYHLNFVNAHVVNIVNMLYTFIG